MKYLPMLMILVSGVASANNASILEVVHATQYAGPKGKYVLMLREGRYKLDGVAYYGTTQLNNITTPYLVIDNLTEGCVKTIMSLAHRPEYLVTLPNISVPKLLKNIVAPPAPDAYYSYTFSAGKTCPLVHK